MSPRQFFVLFLNVVLVIYLVFVPVAAMLIATGALIDYNHAAMSMYITVWAVIAAVAAWVRWCS